MCSSWIKSEKCSGKHNTLICYKQNSESPITDELTRKGQIESSRAIKNCSETNTAENDNSVLSYKCLVQNPLKNNEVFLQMCFARIKNNMNLNSLKCVILYDSASQRNCINISLVRKWKLPVIRKESLIIYPFS